MDLISRQAAISICDNAIDLWNGQLGTGALVAVRDAIMALPSADRPQGVWVFHKDNMPHVRWTRWECDQCHNRTEFISDYCPNCGSRMVREEGEEE